MEILFAGVRGSAPRGGPGYTRWGGHSTCVLATAAGGGHLLLDCGSGIQHAAAALGPDVRELTVLFTHLHLDHVLGFPMLPLLHREGARITVASALPADTLRHALERLMSAPLWPIGLEAVPAAIEFVTVPGDGTPWTRGDLTVRGATMPHPGGVTAWRVDDAAGGAFVQATDVEWSGASPSRRDRFTALCAEPRPADLLAMDGQFPAAVLDDFAGWGHSSPEQCLDVAAAAGVGALRIVHHAPHHDDDALDALDAAVRAASPVAALAREGETHHLPSATRDRKDAL